MLVLGREPDSLPFASLHRSSTWGPQVLIVLGQEASTIKSAMSCDTNYLQLNKLSSIIFMRLVQALGRIEVTYGGLFFS